MIGIYRILNTLTNQSYIGQSRDIAKRIEEHFYHRTTSNASEIDKAINYYGIQNFMFQIIEICKFEDLDWKEDYYIKFFGSNIYGYNQIAGGQNNAGESNSNSKITANDVYYIREQYNNHANPNHIYKIYKDKISISYFFNLWEGKSWPNVHMDVYTPENKAYFKNIPRESQKVRFTDEEVMAYRNRYINETAEEIYNSISTECNFNAFKAMISGNTYKHLPIYSKKKKIWINN